MTDSPPEIVSDPFPPALSGLRILALLVGVIALAACGYGYTENAAHFFRSWLFAYMFWLGLTGGCLAFVMISRMTGGGWGVVIRRFGETAFMNLPLMALFFLPLTFGYKYLFPWARIETYVDNAEVHRLLMHRAAWMNPNSFTARGFAYIVILSIFAFVLNAGSRKLDREPNLSRLRRLRMVSAGGIVLYFILMTSFAIDMIMSRETNWYSSILGFIVIVGQGASGMSFMVLMLCIFAKRRPIKDVLVPQHLNDLGNLLLTLVILWAYTSFAQLLVIWTGNTKEDIGYYTHRGLGVVPNGWRWVALFLIIGHFFVPFFCLLMRDLKRKVPTLAAIAVFLLLMRITEALWFTGPSGPNRVEGQGGVYWTDITAWLGMGGIWLFMFLFMLSKRNLLALNANDQPPFLNHESALQHGH